MKISFDQPNHYEELFQGRTALDAPWRAQLASSCEARQGVSRVRERENSASRTGIRTPPEHYIKRIGISKFAIRHSLFVLLLSGCAATRPAAQPLQHTEPRQRAMAGLKAAIGYEANPVVRVTAVEALQTVGGEQAYPWIRSALTDEEPAVRFAACVAIGVVRDSGGEGAVRRRLNDEHPSVRVAAAYALHRLGDTRYSGLMPTTLLDHDDAMARRNAALVLGLLDDRGAIRVLARAMKDRDAGVRHHVLEALARLGNREAIQELLFMTNAGVGSEEVFALNALANLHDRRYLDTFGYKLATGVHIETRLAAARGLGLLGDDRGFDLALRSLFRDRPATNDPNDPPEDQILRIRQLAAGALGAIGRAGALPALSRVLETDPDPRLQVSAAKAIMEILNALGSRTALPFDRRQ
jgi:HEAT repeat protein